MNERNSMQSSNGWGVASMVVMLMDIIGFVVLVLITLGTKSKFGQIFTDLDTASIPIVTMCLISIPSGVYLFLFVGLIVALAMKEKYILNGPLKFSINMFVLIGEWAYLLVYLVAVYLPLVQIIEKLNK